MRSATSMEPPNWSTKCYAKSMKIGICIRLRRLWRFFSATTLIGDRIPEEPCIFLLGNHELELLESIKKPQRYRKWKSIGGVETLLSYGVEPTILLSTERPDLVRDRLVERMPERHV